MARVLPTLFDRGGREDAAEVRVDDRRGVVADVRARESGPRTFGERSSIRRRQPGSRKRVVGRERDPVPASRRSRGSAGTRGWRPGPKPRLPPASSTTTSGAVDLRPTRSSRCRRRRSSPARPAPRNAATVSRSRSGWFRCTMTTGSRREHGVFNRPGCRRRATPSSAARTSDTGMASPWPPTVSSANTMPTSRPCESISGLPDCPGWGSGLKRRTVTPPANERALDRGRR